MATSKKTPTPLAVTDCCVTAARGYARFDGGIAFSGLLWVRDQPIASFENDGNGGCNRWVVRNREGMEEFKSLAASQRPESQFEQEDYLVGTLWDAAYLRGAA